MGKGKRGPAGKSKPIKPKSKKDVDEGVTADYSFPSIDFAPDAPDDDEVRERVV